MTIHRAQLVVILTFISSAAATQAHAQQHFTECTTNGDNNATVVVPDTVVVDGLGPDEAIESGDEIALYTENDTCAGVGIVVDDETLTIAAAGVDEFSPDGFANGEVISYRIWNASTDVVYRAAATISRCIFGCPTGRDRYVQNEVYIIGRLEARSNVSSIDLSWSEAAPDGTPAALTWRTASEMNNAGFDIEHQRVNDDAAAIASAWTRLAFVDGHGTTTEAQSYRFEPPALSPGVHRFRVKQIDVDGTFEYSDVLEVDVALDGAFELTGPHPNPFRTRAGMLLSVGQAQAVKVELFNVLGQRVALLHDANVDADKPLRVDVDGSRLSSGLYVVRISGETIDATRRLVLTR